MRRCKSRSWTPKKRQRRRESFPPPLATAVLTAAGELFRAGPRLFCVQGDYQSPCVVVSITRTGRTTTCGALPAPRQA